MSVLDIIYTLLIGPLQLMFEVLYMLTNTIIDDPGMSIIALSLMMNFLVLPLYMRADAMQEHERDMEAKLRDGIAHIKKTFKGDEKVMMLQTYYRQNDYKPTDVFKGSISLFLEIPFFISAYMFLSHLSLIQGVPFLCFEDLGSPDGLIKIGDFSINVMPFVMTGINLISCALFTKGMPTKTKVQLYGMAAFFLVFLYGSPSGLVFYWTLNNLFALVKTIFYKLKNPKRVLVIMFAIVGVVAFAYGLLFYQGTVKKTALIVLIGLGCMVPALVTLVKSKASISFKRKDRDPSKAAFISGALFLTVLLGAVIPSAVISASAQEFVILSNFVHPDWYIVSSLCLAAGMFLVWFGVFYWLCNRRAKVVFETAIWIACGVAVLDYMAFGGGMGLLSNSLQYDEGLVFTMSQNLVNAACVVGLGVVMAILYLRFPKLAQRVAAVGAVALVVMAGYNVVNINGSVDDLMPEVESYSDTQPEFTLSKTGQNVVVIMLDRALAEYVPYIMNEKPELKEAFSGFTYYDNVFSFGNDTNLSTPSLFGGYEYTCSEINARAEEALVDKQNEALRVMPVMFDESGYDVTVFDPPYANYDYASDSTIYSDYPGISCYLAESAFVSEEQTSQQIKNNKRNFFCFSVMKSMPYFIQTVLYNSGSYNNSDEGWGVQIISDDCLTADGLDTDYMTSASELENLATMTRISDDSQGGFLMMANQTTHSPALLQEGEYEAAEHVDNTEYEAENADRWTLDGVTIDSTDSDQVTHYQVNVSSFNKLAKWFQYLKDNGVYDNTRIILVGDHGWFLGLLSEMVLDDSEDLYDMEWYYPLLMVKDFNATGELQTSSEFMSTADVPTIATDDVIENPVNPFTGNAINSDAKNAPYQLVWGSHIWDTNYNHGNVFDANGVWFSVHDDVRVKANWTVIADQRPEQ